VTAKEPLFEITLKEPEGEFKRKVFPLIFTPSNLQKFFDKAKKYPTLYGKELLDDPTQFINLFLSQADGQLSLNGLFWAIADNAELDGLVGVFYMTDIIESEALVHYTFFDRRHKGRQPLVKEMLKFAFNKYRFQRLSVEIPLYTISKHKNQNTIRFILDCGFFYEGKKRKAAHYRGDWYDVNMYGILRTEALRDGSPKN
jgi:RimJ/RimL family protein N-acetyltransferase